MKCLFGCIRNKEQSPILQNRENSFYRVCFAESGFWVRGFSDENDIDASIAHFLYQLRVGSFICDDEIDVL